ncbi:HDOD domain-containing protein [Thalassotalea sp. 1_MG-2023]|uniref:HDOD domain-containing protein n=1 Tax=Thalassotalea sp. 1_MG-2023 TaxID=3062680 RepID=UPI0026E36FB2|nr:HDOD domain-containing protein [Thalassotalea sp. 1_MG-2023]MDO6427222.1 HDOD domain-containing protein [Thalassotalea sp. 1_MG-2023]
MLEVDEKVLADIKRGFSVPPQPELLLRLQHVIAADEPDINQVASIISQDVAVSSTVIKAINSPIYGLARSISDINKATKFIGLTGISTLVTNILMQRCFSQNDSSIALEEFWDNAQSIASTSVNIGKKIKLAVSTDKLFSLGLFHDCGIPVLAMKYPNYSEIYQQAFNTPSKTLTAIEDEIFHVNHATIGYYVAKSWRLPKEICQLILCHHDRQFLSTSQSRSQQVYFAILKMAENLVFQQKHFRDAPDWEAIKEDVFCCLDFDQEDYLDLLEESIELQASA